jgi:CheY-like chemotaxis protein
LTEPTPSGVRPQEPAAGREILLAEDNELNFELARDLLEAAGHRVSWARDGLQALEMASSRRIDLLVLDLHLPGISGQEVLRRLRLDAGNRDLPILVLTADAMQGTGAAVLEGGANAYMSKPFDLAAVRDIVASLLT